MILVTGGTGLVGAHLLLSLLEKGETVRAIYRNLEHVSKTKALFVMYQKESFFAGIDWMQGDIIDIPSLEKAFVGIHTVYHCAAHISFNPKEEQLSRKINIEGTANIVNLALFHEVKKLCHVSSIAALGHPKTPTENITEETEWNPELAIDHYSISKYGAEMEILRGEQEGLKTVIVNPGVIIGPGFWNQSSGILFAKIINRLPYYTKGNAAYTDINDLVSVMIALTQNLETGGSRYIVVNENCAYEKIFKTILSSVKSTKKLKLAPDYLLKGYHYCCSILNFLGIKRFVFSKNMYNSATTVKHYANTKVTNQLNYSFKSVEQSVKETAKYYNTSATL